MQETKKLFDADAYAVEFEAVVLSATFLEDAGSSPSSDRRGKRKFADSTDGQSRECRDPLLWELILDQTLFFPEEGGQTPDRGTIGGFPVVDVRLDGGVIRHFVQVPETAGTASSGSTGDQPPFVAGETVRGTIDFAHRFSNMQNHSGEHILSGLAHGRFGCDNVGFHLSDNTVTLDFNRPLSEADIAWLETAANRVVWDDREIRAWYPSQEELETAQYRSKKEIDGPLRLVEIPGVDLCACCAPHVRRTGEIGLIKILRTLREKNGIRLTILCGSRALAYLQRQQQAVEEVSHLTNMPREEIAAGAARILAENEQLRQRGAALEMLYTEALAAAVPADREDVFLFPGNASAKEAVPAGAAQDGQAPVSIGNLAQRRLVNALCAAHGGYCGVFVGSDEAGYKYIIGAGTKKKDARALNACLHKYCGARGGGKPAMVQGSVKAAEDEIRRALERALHELEV